MTYRKIDKPLMTSILTDNNIRVLRSEKLRLTLKVARYSFSGPIPPKFEHKLRRRKQSFGKIDTTVVLDKDENLV